MAFVAPAVSDLSPIRAFLDAARAAWARVVTGVLRWRGAVVWRTAVPHEKSAIGPSSLFYSSNGEDVSFLKVLFLTLPVRDH